MTPFIVNVMTALNVDNNFLIIQRPKKGYAANTLSFPGGKVDLEDALHASKDVLKEAALRELSEEVGIDLKCEPEFIQSTYFYAAPKEAHALTLLFKIELDERPLVTASAREVQSHDWLSADQIKAHALSPIWLKLAMTHL